MLGGCQQLCAEVAPKLSDYADKVVGKPISNIPHALQLEDSEGTNGYN